MRKITTGLCFTLISFIGGASLRAATGESTPAGTLAAFTKAMSDGDAAKLSTLVTGDAKEQAWAVAFSAQIRAFAELDQALVKHFGADFDQKETGISIREELNAGRDEQLLSDLKHATLGKPDGDTVLVIFDEAASTDLQGRLVKVDGQWKMQIESLANYFSVDDTPGLHAIADAANGLAADINTGKLATLDDALPAVQERLTAAQAVGAKVVTPEPQSKSPRPNQH